MFLAYNIVSFITYAAVVDGMELMVDVITGTALDDVAEMRLFFVNL